jgi:hypothetical protein
VTAGTRNHFASAGGLVFDGVQTINKFLLVVSPPYCVLAAHAAVQRVEIVDTIGHFCDLAVREFRSGDFVSDDFPDSHVVLLLVSLSLTVVKLYRTPFDMSTRKIKKVKNILNQSDIDPAYCRAYCTAGRFMDKGRRCMCRGGECGNKMARKARKN